MRNPVGPLPSSIYWRRRAVALCVLALVAVLIFWAVNSGGGGGGSGNNGSPGTHTPVSSITPGPEPTGTHITGRPGGRDTSGGSGGSSSSGGASGSGANGGSTNGSSAGSGSTAGGDGGTGGGASSGGASSGGASAGGASAGGASAGGAAAGGASSGGATSGSGGQLPASSTLPTCGPGTVQLSLKSVQNSYAPGETPTFQLRATNSGSASCKLDFGPTKAVFTITAAAGDSHTWASDDCPPPGSGSYLLQVPAHGSTTYTLRWNSRTSAPQCAAPKGSAAAPGTYLVQARLSGYGTKQASFVLSQD
jgi:hypothetical protein